MVLPVLLGQQRRRALLLNPPETKGARPVTQATHQTHSRRSSVASPALRSVVPRVRRQRGACRQRIVRQRRLGGDGAAARPAADGNGEVWRPLAEVLRQRWTDRRLQGIRSTEGSACTDYRERSTTIGNMPGAPSPSESSRTVCAGPVTGGEVGLDEGGRQVILVGSRAPGLEPARRTADCLPSRRADWYWCFAAGGGGSRRLKLGPRWEPATDEPDGLRGQGRNQTMRGWSR